MVMQNLWSGQAVTDPIWGPHHEREPMLDTAWIFRNQGKDSPETQDWNNMIIQKQKEQQQKREANEIIYLFLIVSTYHVCVGICGYELIA